MNDDYVNRLGVDAITYSDTIIKPMCHNENMHRLPQPRTKIDDPNIDSWCDDPTLLLMSVYGLRLSTNNYVKRVIHQEASRAIELQQSIRDKQIERYQEKINKAIENDDLNHISNFISGFIDSLISIFEIGMGALKILEGIALCNPLEIASGAAYVIAGVAGMVKSFAEFAIGFGADKKSCEAVINIAGTIQTVCECIGVCLDIFQIARAFSAAKKVASTLESKLTSGLSTELSEAISAGSKNAISELAEEASNSVAKDAVSKFGAMEREMVSVEAMQREAIEYALQAEKYMTKNIGGDFSRDLLADTVKTSIKEVCIGMIEQGKVLSGNMISKSIIKEFIKKIEKIILSRINDFFTYQTIFSVCKKTSLHFIAVKSAFLQRDIDNLIAYQQYNDSTINGIDKVRKGQQEQLKENLKNDSDDFSKLFELMKTIFMNNHKLVNF